MLSGFENTIVKDAIRELGFLIVDIHHEISGVNDNMASISEILTRLDDTHLKDAIRDLGF
jgi:hypothetical protein